MFKPIAISVFCLATVVAAAAHASDGKQANGVGVTRDGDADPVSRRKADLRACSAMARRPKGTQARGVFSVTKSAQICASKFASSGPRRCFNGYLVLNEKRYKKYSCLRNTGVVWSHFCTNFWACRAA
jgi:hypothetical protein